MKKYLLPMIVLLLIIFIVPNDIYAKPEISDGIKPNYFIFDVPYIGGCRLDVKTGKTRIVHAFSGPINLSTNIDRVYKRAFPATGYDGFIGGRLDEGIIVQYKYYDAHGNFTIPYLDNPDKRSSLVESWGDHGPCPTNLFFED